MSSNYFSKIDMYNKFLFKLSKKTKRPYIKVFLSDSQNIYRCLRKNQDVLLRTSLSKMLK